MLYEVQTEHQHLVLFEHPFFGKMLMLDGATQVTSKDEFIYHEMMTHVPIFAHGKAREVLIVGGGDCGIAEEVLKHKSVERLTQVEIDASVVEFSKEHFPEFTKPVLTNKRFDLVIDDGMNYVAKTERRFDVIIVDSTDPQGPGKVLFSEKFYAACKRCMTKGGVMVTQNGVPIFQAERAHRRHQEISQAVRRRILLRGRDPDLCGRPHGHGLGHRQRQIAASLGQDHRRSLQEGRQLRDQVLDARGARRGLRAAALHRRQGDEGERALSGGGGGGMALVRRRIVASVDASLTMPATARQPVPKTASTSAICLSLPLRPCATVAARGRGGLLETE